MAPRFFSSRELLPHGASSLQVASSLLPGRRAPCSSFGERLQQGVFFPSDASAPGPSMAPLLERLPFCSSRCSSTPHPVELCKPGLQVPSARTPSSLRRVPSPAAPIPQQRHGRAPCFPAPCPKKKKIQRGPISRPAPLLSPPHGVELLRRTSVTCPARPPSIPVHGARPPLCSSHGAAHPLIQARAGEAAVAHGRYPAFRPAASHAQHNTMPAVPATPSSSPLQFPWRTAAHPPKHQAAAATSMAPLLPSHS
uniref:Uncharacterized protein n=1 Tax=Zea mays TaxID=4577 RepID=A0A804REC9_MAIZE